MTLYGRDFAEVYSNYGYNEFSARVAERLPRVLARLRVKPRQVLDLIFDMNTPGTLSRGWQRHPSFVEVDTRDAFVVHRSTWDARTRIATLKVTCFLLRNRHWFRIDEVHRERGYALPQIRTCLRQVGFTEVACWGASGR